MNLADVVGSVSKGKKKSADTQNKYKEVLVFAWWLWEQVCLLTDDRIQRIQSRPKLDIYFNGRRRMCMIE